MAAGECGSGVFRAPAPVSLPSVEALDLLRQYAAAVNALTLSTAASPAEAQAVPAVSSSASPDGALSAVSATAAMSLTQLPMVIPPAELILQASSAFPMANSPLFPKMEPMSNSSTGTEDNNLAEVLRQMPVPACSICGADSTGIHFGVEACAACSAFFRRTVVLNKNYVCAKDNNCNVLKDAANSQKCRACRFRKCNKVGMDRSAVQHRRDAIGKYSTLVKRECPSPSEEGVERMTPCSPKMVRLEKTPTILEEFVQKHEMLSRRRRIFYSSNELQELFDESGELMPQELSNFGECMYQLWRIEPRLCADFVSSNRFLQPLPASEKTQLFKSFLLQFQAVEEPYLTWKFGGLDKKWWMMPNRTYVDFDHADQYFDGPVMKDLNLDKPTALRIFLPSFQHAKDIVGEQMRIMNMSYKEMVALSALLLLDPTADGIADATKTLLKQLRDSLVKELLETFQREAPADEPPEVRLGNLLLMISGVKVHAQRSRENMHMLKFFDICPRDKLFDEIVGIAPTEPVTPLPIASSSTAPVNISDSSDEPVDVTGD